MPTDRSVAQIVILQKKKVDELYSLIGDSLASHAHRVWARWMEYMLDNLDENHIAHWRYQASSPFENLPESMKPSDHEIARAWLLKVISGLAECGYSIESGTEIGR